MGINFNNFLNSSMNQHVADALKQAHDLKGEWREAKSSGGVANIMRTPEMKEWVRDNPEEAGTVFRDNRDKLIELFGRYHFTISAGDAFYYVWKFDYNDSPLYLYASKDTITLEAADTVESLGSCQDFILRLANYLK